MNVEEHGEFCAHERFLKGLLENELQKTKKPQGKLWPEVIKDVSHVSE